SICFAKISVPRRGLGSLPPRHCGPASRTVPVRRPDYTGMATGGTPPLVCSWRNFLMRRPSAKTVGSLSAAALLGGALFAVACSGGDPADPDPGTGGTPGQGGS